jgi:hypothetical protein
MQALFGLHPLLFAAPRDIAQHQRAAIDHLAIGAEPFGLNEADFKRAAIDAP